MVLLLFSTQSNKQLLLITDLTGSLADAAHACGSSWVNRTCGTLTRLWFYRVSLWCYSPRVINLG